MPHHRKVQSWFQAQTRQIKSLIIALGVLGFWMLSGLLTTSSVSQQKQPEIPVVQTEYSVATPLERTLRLEGHTEAEKFALIKAQTEGTIEKIHIPQGQLVKKGTLLLSLTPEDRPAKLQEAKARLKQLEMELKTAKKLGKEGFQSKNNVAEAVADLAMAKAQLETAQTELDHTQIKAPFDGIFEKHHADEGTTVQKGDALVTVIKTDPLKVIGYAPQDSAINIQPGSIVKVTFATGTLGEAKVTYIAKQGEEATRTYTMEALLPNPEQTHLAGSSVALQVPLKTVLAHKISPAFLSLSEKGILGVKYVDEKSIARFAPVTLEKTTPEGAWVSGLSENIRLITLGHGFVTDGQPVRFEEDGKPQPQTAGADE